MLNSLEVVRKRSGRRRRGVTPLAANFPHGPLGWMLLPSVLPFTERSSATPGELLSPKRCGARSSLPHPSRPRTLSALPYRPLLPGLRIPHFTGLRHRDDVGLSSVTVVSHFVQVMPSQTLARPAGCNRVPTCETTTDGRRGFSNVRNLAHRTCRIATPPELSLPGPFTATRCRATLAAYPLRLFGSARASPHCLGRGSSKDFRTGSDPHG